MKMTTKFTFKSVLIVLSIMLLAACSENRAGDSNNQDGKTNEKIELSILYKGSEDKFKETYKNLIEQKFPNITLVPVPEMTQEMIATGNVPDIIEIDNQGNIATKLIKNGLQYDMGDLIKKHNFDLSRLDVNVIAHVKAFGDGKVYALPKRKDLYALYYNKDIFDKLGEKYPDPNRSMTWEETIALAKRLTRNVGGVQYRGLSLEDPTMILFGAPYLFAEPGTDEPRFLTDPYIKRYFEMFNEILDIPGIFPGPDKTKYVMKNKHEGFAKDKNVAMYFFFNSAVSRLIEAEKEGLNWDLAPMPSWKDFPNQSPFSKGNLFSISPVSKNKDAAFNVIAYLLSDEVQLLRSRQGTASILNNPEIEKVFYADVPEMKKHHVEAFFVTKPNPGSPAPYSKYEQLLTVYDYSGKEFPKQNKDINTVLRELTAEGKKIIAEEKSKQK